MIFYGINGGSVEAIAWRRLAIRYTLLRMTVAFAVHVDSNPHFDPQLAAYREQ